MVFLRINVCFTLGVLLTCVWFSHILCISSSVQLPKVNMAVMISKRSLIPLYLEFLQFMRRGHCRRPFIPLSTSFSLVSKWPKLLLPLHGLLLVFRFCLVRWCIFHNWENMRKAFWKMEAVVAENSPNFRESPARRSPHCAHLEASKRQSRSGPRFR